MKLYQLIGDAGLIILNKFRFKVDYFITGICLFEALQINYQQWICVLGMGYAILLYVILLWHSLSFPYNYFTSLSTFFQSFWDEFLG